MFLCLALLAGCSIRVVGMMEPGSPYPQIATIEGKHVPVMAHGFAEPLAYLDGELVEATGRRVFGPMAVQSWRVLEGSHGMAVWVGSLVRVSTQNLGIHDRDSGVMYLLDAKASRSLQGAVGQVVLVEGYVDGAHRVQVTDFRILEGPR